MKMKFKKYQLNNQDLEIIKNLKSLLAPSSEFEQKSKIRILNLLPDKEVSLSRFTKPLISSFAFIGKSAVIAMLVIFLSASVSYASQNSLPGDFFYPAKRVFEAVSLNLAVKKDLKLKLKINAAQNRLAEANKLLEKKEKKDLIYQILLDYNEMMVDINEIIKNDVDALKVEIAELENNYQQIIGISSKELKTQLQIHQKSPHQDFPDSIKQEQLNQQAENNAEIKYDLDDSDNKNNIDYGKNSPAKLLNDTENMPDKEIEQIEDSEKYDQVPINKP